MSVPSICTSASPFPAAVPTGTSLNSSVLSPLFSAVWVSSLTSFLSCSVVVVDDLSSCSVVFEDDLSSSSGDGDARLEMCDRRVEYANTLPLSSRVSTTIDANACAVLFTNFISLVAHCFWRKDRHSFRFCYRGVASSGNHTSMSQGEFRGYGCPTRIISQPDQAH